MRPDARLNLLLTPPPRQPYERGGASFNGSQPWHRTVSQLLVPLGVRTFEASSGPEAVELMERHTIHLAVVDTRLPAIGGLNVLQLIQRLGTHGQRHIPAPKSESTAASEAPAVKPPSAKPEPDPPAADPAAPGSGAGTFELRMEMQQRAGGSAHHIRVRFDARVQAGPAQPAAPVIILIAPPPPQQDKQLLQEALKFNAFSVLSEPVDVNLALEVMARAMKRWFCGQWPC